MNFQAGVFRPEYPDLAGIRSILELMSTSQTRSAPPSGVSLVPESGLGVITSLSAQIGACAAQIPGTSSFDRLAVFINGRIAGVEDTSARLRCISPNQDKSRHLPEIFPQRLNPLQLRGAFVMAVLDKVDRSLTLVRDRLGGRPLYYGYCGGDLVFSVDMRLIEKHPAFVRKLNGNAVQALLRGLYIPAPLSIYRGVFKLPPGSMVTFGIDDVRAGRIPEVKRYFRLEEEALCGLENTSRAGVGEALAHLEGLLQASVSSAMPEKGEVGIFLSGGTDSSTVAAIAASMAKDRIVAFSLAPDCYEYDESGMAAKVAKRLGIRHVCVKMDETGFRDGFSGWLGGMDEPFADSSALGLRLLIEAAHKAGIATCLSGDGGDEAFCGYNRHIYAPLIYNLSRILSERTRRGLRGLLLDRCGQTSAFIRRVISEGSIPPLLMEKLRKVAGIIGADDRKSAYLSLLMSGYADNRESGEGWDWNESPFTAGLFELDMSFRDKMRLLDQMLYLPECGFAKADKSADGLPLTIVPPLAEASVIRFAWSLPGRLLVRRGRGKVILRALLGRYLPEDLLCGGKRGFALPIGTYVRNCLGDEMEEICRHVDFAIPGAGDKSMIRRLRNEHVSGVKDWGHELWAVAALHKWLEAREWTGC